MDNESMVPQEAEFLFFTTPDGKVSIEVMYAGETIWLTQKKMAELFDVGVPAITKHLSNIFESGELSPGATISKMEIVQPEGDRMVRRGVDFYNLDAIISVGYRVNSAQATAFRRWATEVLKNYMIKGFALDEERLKNGTHFGKDYFNELLEKIREIRMSERRLYLQVTDIFAMASDYDRRNELVQEFFAFIQNKLHYAITGHTAAELIVERADKNEPHMGLTTWKASPDGKILRTDVTTAKNYLNPDELHKLRLAVTAFLDIAQSRAEREIPTGMKEWLGIMDSYLDLSAYPKLQNAGKVSKKDADTHALREYAEFRVKQDQEYVGDFERATMQALDQGKLEP